MLRYISRDDFIENLTGLKEDRFANTFRSKADMQGLWPCIALVTESGEVASALAFTVSKAGIANLQLLHTFFVFRRNGYGCRICFEFLRRAKVAGAKYFRVSAEPGAVEFYKGIGMKFLGVQKSGSSLSMARIVGPRFNTCEYDINDPVIHKAVYKKGKGGCVSILQDQ